MFFNLVTMLVNSKDGNTCWSLTSYRVLTLRSCSSERERKNSHGKERKEETERDTEEGGGCLTASTGRIGWPEGIILFRPFPKLPNGDSVGEGKEYVVYILAPSSSFFLFFFLNSFDRTTGEGFWLLSLFWNTVDVIRVVGRRRRRCTLSVLILRRQETLPFRTRFLFLVATGGARSDARLVSAPLKRPALFIHRRLFSWPMHRLLFYFISLSLSLALEHIERHFFF